MLRLAVSDAGFISTWIRFEATGTLVAAEDSMVFKVTGMSQMIPVKSDDALEKLRQTIGQERTQIVLVGLIPPGEESAQIERFTAP